MRERVVLTAGEIAIARALARELAQDVDRNELGKVLAYLARTGSKAKFLELLRRLPQSGCVHSGRTRLYLNRIRQACETHLAPINDDRRVLAVLGWSFRLMTSLQTQMGTRSARSRSRSDRR